MRIAAAQSAVAVTQAHDHPVFHVFTAFLSSLRLLAGELEAADDMAAQALRMPEVESRPFAYATALSVRAAVAAERGHLTAGTDSRPR
jgi:hypothetical protein